MQSGIKSLLLIFMLLNGSVVSASALMDICCDFEDRVSADALLSDGTEVHIAHCCHAGVHFSALYPNTHLDDSRVQVIWPTTTATDAALLTEAPPVPPPNV